MNKLKCPYSDDFNKCPHVMDASKNKRKSKEIIKKSMSTKVSNKLEHCDKCGQGIKKGTRFVEWIIKKQTGVHVNDLETVGKEINCASCIGVGKI